MQWTPVERPPPQGEHTPSEAEHRQVKETMVHAWEEETCTSYSAGLLMWLCFCDSKGVLEEERAPAQQTLVSAFMAHMATTYSGKTITNYLSRVRTWHLLHSIPWALKKKEMEVMLRATEKLTPATLKRKKRMPYTPMLQDQYYFIFFLDYWCQGLAEPWYAQHERGAVGTRISGSMV